MFVLVSNGCNELCSSCQCTCHLGARSSLLSWEIQAIELCVPAMSAKSSVSFAALKNEKWSGLVPTRAGVVGGAGSGLVSVTGPGFALVSVTGASRFDSGTCSELEFVLSGESVFSLLPDEQARVRASRDRIMDGGCHTIET